MGQQSILKFFTVLISATFFISFTSKGQPKVLYQKTTINVEKINTIFPKKIENDFQPKLSSLEMPSPGSAKHRLSVIKKKSAKLYPRTSATYKTHQTNTGNVLSIDQGFPLALYTYIPALNDTIVSYLVGGRPNDNTLAIGNNGMLVTSYNSSIFAYDTEADTLLFSTSLHAFSSEFTLNDKYDPKALYDPVADRFILVFLNGRLSTDMRIIVCFSTSNNPADPWNLYELPGNPLNNTTWTDYPAIAITKGELFLTGNLLRDNEPWQTGFAETIIWQVDLQDGYVGSGSLNSRLWSDIKFGNTYIRNMNPVQGGSMPSDSGMYLLSNRNFDILNDTIFLAKIEGSLRNSNATLSVNYGRTDTPYGAPPLGRQINGEDSLATNDARVLGGFIENGEIQYVANTIDHSTGFAGVYHGFIDHLDTDPRFTGTILSNDVMDFGYPNIAFTGNESCSRQSIIAFNHTSPIDSAGVSAIMYNSDDTYSPRIMLKKGEGIIDRANGPERWGDYFGIQRKYNEDHKVWTAGYYSRENGNNYTWVSELNASTDNTLSAGITDSTVQSAYGSADASAYVTISGGVEPYEIMWSDTNNQTAETAENLSAGLYLVTVTDHKNCVVLDSVSFVESKPQNAVFPNPTSDLISIYFELNEGEVVSIELFDMKGSLVKHLFKDEVNAGSNVFNFSTSPLRIGSYILKINTASTEILSEKIIKQ